MTYKVADKLGVERKSWKTAFLTSIYNETATVHGRIDRSENMPHRLVFCRWVHGRIDRSESTSEKQLRNKRVHGRIDRSENASNTACTADPVHGRIDRSESFVKTSPLLF